MNPGPSSSYPSCYTDYNTLVPCALSAYIILYSSLLCSALGLLSLLNTYCTYLYSSFWVYHILSHSVQQFIENAGILQCYAVLMGEWFLTSWLTVSASVSKSEQSKKVGLLNFFLDWFLEFKGTRILQNIGGPSSTDTTSYPRIHETMITPLWEPQNLTQQFLLSLGLDTSLIWRACTLIKLLSIDYRYLSHEHKMAKHCATYAPQILAGSVTLSVFFPLGAFVFGLALGGGGGAVGRGILFH